MGYVKANNHRVIEMLKSIGMPENCIGASILFDAGKHVSIYFEKIATDGDIETLRLFFEDKVHRKEPE